MFDTLHQLFQPDPLRGIAMLALSLLLFLVVGLGPILAGLYLVFYLLTLPMRRNERARLFLDLLELGLKEGRSPEAAILDAASSGDRSLGKRFQTLATYLKQGLKLSLALDFVPRLAPPQVRAMLKVGERIGDIPKVLPACRMLLRDSVSHVRGAINYVVLLAFVVTPFTTFIPVVLKVRVLPAFQRVFVGLFDGMQLPAFTALVFNADTIWLTIQVGLLSVAWLLTLAYLGGPRLRAMLGDLLVSDLYWLDALVCRLPWRRKRLQRDFSAMLALLLEAGVPEAEAVSLAGESTANAVFRRRADKVATQLRQGAKLPDALAVVDDTGELRWRLANAFRRAGGFVRALTGWHEALDAKAFQQEQAAAQITSTVLVLINGFLVGCVVLAIFLALISLLNMATLW